MCPLGLTPAHARRVYVCVNRGCTVTRDLQRFYRPTRRTRASPSCRRLLRRIVENLAELPLRGRRVLLVTLPLRKLVEQLAGKAPADNRQVEGAAGWRVAGEVRARRTCAG